MAMQKAKEFRDQSTEELQEQLRIKRKEVFDLRGTVGKAKGEKIHLIRHKRKEIARMMTVLGERGKNE